MRIPSQFTNSQARSKQPLIGPSAQPTPDDLGAGVGRGLQQLAGGAKVLADVVVAQDEKRRRFVDLSRFSHFQTEMDNELLRMKREEPPQDFGRRAETAFDERAMQFLRETDPEFQEEFRFRLLETRGRISLDALSHQYTATDQLFRDGLSQAIEAAKVDLGQNPSQENFDLTLGQLTELIGSTGLTPPEQQSIARQTQRALSAILYKEEQKRLLTETDSSGITAAASIVEEFTGATPEEAAALAEQGALTAASEIGREAWLALPTRARAAIASYASSEGGLSPALIDAAKSGDLEALAAAFDDGSENPRSLLEANLIRNAGAQLDDDTRFSQLPYEDRLAIREDARREVVAQQNAEAAAEKQAMETAQNYLMIEIYEGRAGQVELDTAREAGLFSDYEDLKRAQDLIEKQNEGLLLAQQGWQKMQTGGTFNPGSEDDRDALNAMVGKDGLAALNAMDSNYATGALIPIVRGAQDIPTEAVGLLTGMIRSNNQTKALWALDLLSQMEQASPFAYNARVSSDTASAVELWRSRKDFYDPTTLLRLINGGQTQAERQETKYMREEAQAVLRDEEVRGNLLAEFGTFGGLPLLGWGAQYAQPSNLPWAARGLESDFDRIFEDQYTIYRNVDEARTHTISALRRVWGVASIDGVNQLMKNPPHLIGYPPIAGSYDWMAEQLRTEVVFNSVEDQRNNQNGAPLIGEADGFELVNDAQTETEVDAFRRGGPPASYMLVRIRDGQPGLVLDSNGVPRRVWFDPTEEQRAEELEWRSKQVIESELDENITLLQQAEEHQRETGIPVPLDLLEGPGIDSYSRRLNEMFGRNERNLEGR